MNNVILSGKYPEYGDKLRRLGYHVIPGETVAAFLPYERDHADMQCLIIDDKAFVLRCCESLAACLSPYYHVVPCGAHITGKYPGNVALNAAVIGKRVIARLASLDEAVIRYCKENGYELINVNQGYAKCACAVVGDHALITADKGIYHSLKEINFDILLIQEGRVRLPGAPYGFIGGASGLDGSDAVRKLYFSGNIRSHPDGAQIIRFCKQHNIQPISLDSSELTDIGGMIFC